MVTKDREESGESGKNYCDLKALESRKYFLLFFVGGREVCKLRTFGF
jgi:hypothetical protein